jgi:hypothetical protein
MTAKMRNFLDQTGGMRPLAHASVTSLAALFLSLGELAI